MKTAEAYGARTISEHAHEATIDSLREWRHDYRSAVFTAYPQPPDATGLIEAATINITPFLPSAEYASGLRDELLYLHRRSSEHLNRNVLFPNSLRSVGLTKDEFFKGVVLGDLVTHGESMIRRALLGERNEPSPDPLTETLAYFNTKPEAIHPFGSLGEASLEGVSTADEERGALVASIASAAGYVPSAGFIDRCIFLDKLNSGSGMSFKRQKTILIGTGTNILAEREESDLAERIRVFIHELIESGLSEMSQIAVEYSSIENEATGITSIRMLPEMDIAPLSWSELLYWLHKTRDHSDASKARLLARLASPILEEKLEADHNIAAFQKENDIEAKRVKIIPKDNGIVTK